MHLLNKLTRKIKSYKSEHPLKFKYIIISSSGIAALTLSVIIVSSSSILKDSTPEKILQYAQNTSPGYTQKSTKSSRGGTSLDPLKGDIVKLGVKNSIVTVIQKKLTELDYIESDEPTEEFGETLENAVKLFQRKNELKITGEVNAETYKLLISDKAKKYTVSVGAKGTDVEQLQSRLYELGYIPKATGYFGTDTEAAVKEFQKRNGLYDDGNVGKSTREKLYSNNAVPLSFYLGDENDKIKQYQERLYELGYLTTNPDGKYGNDTVVAVRRFQENNGVIQDGYIGPATKTLLMSPDAAENAIKLGDSGDSVTNVQKYLVKLGYLRNTTGYFGSDTYKAIVKFQKRNGLTADGKVGSQTVTELLSPDAKKWSASIKSSNSDNASSGRRSSGGSSSGSNSSGSNSSGSSSSAGSSSDDGDYSNASSPNAELIISVAKSKLGARYVYGAKGPDTFDCSGFVYWVLNHAGISQSYMTSYGWNNTGRYQRISSMSSIRRGDIITYNGHVGIALGNNQMIDASSSQGEVRITSLSNSYWTRNFVCAFRIF